MVWDPASQKNFGLRVFEFDSNAFWEENHITAIFTGIGQLFLQSMLCVILDCVHLLTYDCNFRSPTLKLLKIIDLFIMNDLHRGQSHVIYAYGYNGVTSTHDHPLLVYTI